MSSPSLQPAELGCVWVAETGGRGGVRRGWESREGTRVEKKAEEERGGGGCAVQFVVLLFSV